MFNINFKENLIKLINFKNKIKKHNIEKRINPNKEDYERILINFLNNSENKLEIIQHIINKEEFKKEIYVCKMITKENKEIKINFLVIQYEKNCNLSFMFYILDDNFIVPHKYYVLYGKQIKEFILNNKIIIDNIILNFNKEYVLNLLKDINLDNDKILKLKLNLKS